MSKIFFQGTFGAYSHLAALSIEPTAEIIPCKTFDECFLKASKDPSSKIIIPESNRITGNIGIEYLIFEYRLNIYSEYFQKIEHNLLALPGTKISDLKNIIVKTLDINKAQNIISIDLKDKSSMADYMIIASGSSSRHIQSLSEQVLEKFKDSGIQNSKIEGKDSNEWKLVDGIDLIVHIFHPEKRKFYELEKMWSELIPKEKLII